MPSIHVLDKHSQSDGILSNPSVGITRIQFAAFHFWYMLEAGSFKLQAWSMHCYYSEQLHTHQNKEKHISYHSFASRREKLNIFIWY